MGENGNVSRKRSEISTKDNAVTENGDVHKTIAQRCRKTAARANENTTLVLQPSPEPSPCIAVLAVLDTSYHKTLSSFRFEPWQRWTSKWPTSPGGWHSRKSGMHEPASGKLWRIAAWVITKGIKEQVKRTIKIQTCWKSLAFLSDAVSSGMPFSKLLIPCLEDNLSRNCSLKLHLVMTVTK